MGGGLVCGTANRGTCQKPDILAAGLYGEVWPQVQQAELPLHVLWPQENNTLPLDKYVNLLCFSCEE
jgi:hypothetical protein